MSSKIDKETGEAKSSEPKKIKTKHFSPILFVKLQIDSGKKGRSTKTCRVKALIDSGTSETIIARHATKNSVLKKHASTQKWETAAGKMSTNKKTNKTKFSFPNYTLIST